MAGRPTAASCAWSASARRAGSSDGGWADPADVLGLATAEQPLQFGIGAAAERAGRGEGVRRGRGLGARGTRAHARLAHAAQRADRRRAAAADDPPDDDLLALLAAGLHARHRDRRPRARPAPPDRPAARDRAHARAGHRRARRPLPRARRAGRAVRPRRRRAGRRTGCRRARPTRSARPRTGAPSVALLARLAADRAARRRARPPRCPRGAPGGCRCRRRSRSAAARRSARASRVAGIARRLRLPVVVGVGAKDAFAQRGRTALTVSSLALAAALVATAMGFEATMDRLGSDSGAARPALRAARRVRAAGRRRSTACSRARGEVTAVARIREIVHDRPRARREIHARVLDGPLGAFPYAIRDGRAARAPGRGHARPRRARRAATRAIGDDGHAARRRPAGRAARRRPPRRARRRRPRRGHRARAACPPGAAKLDDPYWGVRLSPGADPVATAAALRREGARADRGRAPDRVAASARPPTCARVVYGTVALLIVDRGAQPADHARARRSASASATTPCSPRSARRRARSARR